MRRARRRAVTGVVATARWTVAGFLVILLLPVAMGQGERAAALVQFVDGASPAAPGLDERLPATRVDGVLLADPAPEGRPESALAHFRELQRLLLLRARTGAPVTLELDARPEGGDLVARLTVRSATHARVDATFVLVEDEARVALPGGASSARFVARAMESPVEVQLASGSGVVERRLLVDSAWRTGTLHVVAYVAVDEEVLQAAVWRSGQTGPSAQTQKLVLVEHATAAWCSPCAPSDDSFALLASQQGTSGASDVAGYARRPDALVLFGLVVGALGAAAIVRRRA